MVVEVVSADGEGPEESPLIILTCVRIRLQGMGEQEVTAAVVGRDATEMIAVRRGLQETAGQVGRLEGQVELVEVEAVVGEGLMVAAEA